MKPDGDPVELLSGTIFKRYIVEAITASVVTLQVYDWLLILPQEVDYIWRASWNWSKALYIFTRYIPFATIALIFQHHFAPNPNPELCKRIIKASVWFSFVGLAFAEAVLITRTYAVWKRDKRVGISLALLFIFCQTAMGVIMEKWVEAANPIKNPYPEVLRGCVFDSGTRLVYVSWVIITVEEGVDLVLMIISAVNTYHKNRSNLMKVIYRDGIRFYLYIFCTTLANILATLLLPIEFVTIGSIIEIVIHSILACRLMVGIREAGQSLGSKLETFELAEAPRNNPLERGNASVDTEPCAGPSKA